ncbi:hypothetical protein DFH11DRAFT_611008 [Phellopilus nigrolimitatus]|nr:hypothetical protein DFH11DRAFT_611008 [Phellopilus nigrolimitatus]
MSSQVPSPESFDLGNLPLVANRRGVARSRARPAIFAQGLRLRPGWAPEGHSMQKTPQKSARCPIGTELSESCAAWPRSCTMYVCVCSRVDTASEMNARLFAAAAAGFRARGGAADGAHWETRLARSRGAARRGTGTGSDSESRARAWSVWLAAEPKYRAAPPWSSARAFSCLVLLLLAVWPRGGCLSLPFPSRLLLLLPLRRWSPPRARVQKSSFVRASSCSVAHVPPPAPRTVCSR